MTTPVRARPTWVDKVIGKNVREFRKKAGMTQDQLSERMDISKSLLSMLETGGRAWNSTTMAAACDSLKIELSELTLTAKERKALELVKAMSANLDAYEKETNS